MDSEELLSRREKMYCSIKLLVYVKSRSIVNFIRYHIKNKMTWLIFAALCLCISSFRKGLAYLPQMNDEYGEVVFSADSISLLIVSGCLVMCAKSLLNWNKIRLRGAYECFAVYYPQKLGNLYLCCLIDRYISFCIVFAIVGGIYIRNLTHVVFLLLFGAFFTMEEFIYGLAPYVRISNLRRTLLLLGNLLCAVFVCFFGGWIKVGLLAGMLALDLLIFLKYGLHFQKYFVNVNGTDRTDKKRVFLSLFRLLQRMTTNAGLAFVTSKEFIQIFMEKIPLIYSFVYGLLFMIIVPFVNKSNENHLISVFCLFTSTAYTLIAVSMNFFARDTKRMWIYKMYQISPHVIMLGKYLAYYIYASGFVALYFGMYALLASVYRFTFTISAINILEIIFLVVPLTFFFGAIAGSLFTPKITYRKGNVNYNYNGLEIVILLATAYFISLPVCIFDFVLSESMKWWLMVWISIIIQVFLGAMLKKRIYIFLSGGELHE